eukprot:gene13125-14474_t
MPSPLGFGATARRNIQSQFEYVFLSPLTIPICAVGVQLPSRQGFPYSSDDKIESTYGNETLPLELCLYDSPTRQKRILYQGRGVVKKNTWSLFTVCIEPTSIQGNFDAQRPRPQTVLDVDLAQASSQQLKDVHRFCSLDQPVGFCSILGVGRACNCGEFCVTITAFHNQLIASKATGATDVMIGPSVTHTTNTEEDYRYLLEQLDTHAAMENKEELILNAAGADGEVKIEKNVIKRYEVKDKEFLHLNCEIHIRDNIIKYCEKTPGIKKRYLGGLIDGIFGKMSGDRKMKGLVDCESCEDFNEMLATLEELWLIEQQKRVMERAFFGIGDFELQKDFAYHRLTMDKWRIMAKDQQTPFLKKMKT